MSDTMVQEEAMDMSDEQAVQILIPMRNMMCDRYGCPISDAVFALDKAIEALSTDRPQGKWIIHYRDKWMVRAECPKCHRRFEFSPRAIWKCCPMCETRMKGADDETAND